MVEETYSHDDHGNVTSMPHLPRMLWDFKDQLRVVSRQIVGASPPPGIAAETTYYVYDSTGQRARKVTERQNGTRRSEQLYLGGLDVYREYDGAGTAITLARDSLHVAEGKRQIALVETEVNATAAVTGALHRYQMSNHLESVCLELDEEGSLITYEEYSPYGNPTFQVARSSAEINTKRYRFTGRERDRESGLSVHGVRCYAPWLGRWVSCDPVQQINLFAYASGNPLRLADPDGLAPRDLIGDALGKVKDAYSANKTKIARYADEFDVAKHANQGKARYLDPLTTVAKERITESEHLIPGAGIKVFNKNYNYEGATTIVLPKEISRVKTVVDNRLTEAAKQGMPAKEFLSRAKANAVRSVADHWAQTGNTTLKQVKKVAQVAEVAEKEAGVVEAVGKVKNVGSSTKSLSGLRCLPIGGFLKVAKPVAVALTVLAVTEKAAQAAPSGASAAPVDKATKMEQTFAKVESGADAVVTAATLVPGPVGQIAGGAQLNAEIGKWGIHATGGDARIVANAKSVESYGKAHGWSDVNAETAGATAAGASSALEGSVVITQALMGPLGWASLATRAWLKY
jgi:RHS repeat-associated protein